MSVTASYTYEKNDHDHPAEVKSMRRSKNVFMSSLVKDVNPSARPSLFLESAVNTDIISRTRENFTRTEAADEDRLKRPIIARTHSSNFSAPAKLNVHYL